MIERVAARVLVVDRDGALLLLRGMDPAEPERGTWWLTPGGGLEDGESPEEGARRELFEETGLVVDAVGPVVFERVVDFSFEGQSFHQRESFYAVRTERFEPVNSAWSDLEHRSLLEHRWWSLADLVATGEQLYPENLGERLAALLGIDVDHEGAGPPVG